MSLACGAGYGWLVYQHQLSSRGKTFGVCVFKHATTLPCPSCGTTRSVLAIFSGDFNTAFMMNPFGFIMAIVMIAGPLWIMFDLILRRSTLWEIYFKMETVVRRRPVALILILLVAVNWIWNIYKDV